MNTSDISSSPSDDKQVIIIAGPNGAGKTTFARSFLPAEAQCLRFINADLIAAGLSPFRPEDVAVKAGRLMLEEIAECTKLGISFALETTLSGLGYLKHIDHWRNSGYWIKLYFLELPSPESAIRRVALRVQQGGHDIPPDVIRRRFQAGIKNFNSHYKHRVSEWMRYDSATEPPTLLEWSVNK